MNNDNKCSWDFSPRVLLHLKQIYIGLQKHGEKQCSQHEEKIKYKLQSHFISSQKALLRSSRSCRDRCDPDAIIENTYYDAINRHCFLVQPCDRGSRENDKIIADRHCFLVGPELFSQWMQSSGWPVDLACYKPVTSVLEGGGYTWCVSPFPPEWKVNPFACVAQLCLFKLHHYFRVKILDGVNSCKVFLFTERHTLYRRNIVIKNI